MDFTRRMKKYADQFDTAVGARRSLARLTHVLGADEPQTTALPPAQKTAFLRDIGATRDVPDGFRTIAGAGAGAYLGFKFNHPFLGGIAGASLARNVPALFHESSRKVALGNMATTGGALAGSLLLAKTPVGPILGFGIGWILSGFAAYYGGLR